LNKIGFPKALAQLLSNPQIEKIGIAVIQDMKELRQQFISFESKEVVDLNILCKNMGFENIGAKNLSALVLGHNISKRQQTSNWETPVLSDAQMSYAATDAWICREIYLKLLAE
jgi:ribonuclease D